MTIAAIGTDDLVNLVPDPKALSMEGIGERIVGSSTFTAPIPARCPRMICKGPSQQFLSFRPTIGGRIPKANEPLPFCRNQGERPVQAGSSI